ncbi:hypothetical protein FEM33_06895 [Dyadobacter flavalbus]|uniref:Uncharacterized protein n=1 Tax=Dyadobacter flavalbus TaxID=2579942 RepID=A0A5M8R051_9BACT|nr:heparin lyase I family protein [Dyadobacter flavalbus]KAA6440326.1 hypothetical protein FEM33_06895 [Dyadobacter flavalbus]
MLTPIKVFDFRQEPAYVSNDFSSSRESEASYYGSDGYLHFTEPGREGLTINEDLDSSAWIKVGAVAIASENVSAIDRPGNAMKLFETEGSGEHRLSLNATVVQGELVTISVYLKAATASRVQFSFANSASYTGGNPSVKFDLETGSVISASSNLIDLKYAYQENGWWKLSITGMPDLDTNSGLHVYLLSDGDSINYEGRENKFLYISGSLLEQGGNSTGYPLRYNYNVAANNPLLEGVLIEPAAINLVPYSQTLINSNWRKQYATVEESGRKSPDGENPAYRIQENTSFTSHYIVPSPIIATEIGRTYTMSAYLKAGERKWAYFNVNGLTVHFDLTEGIVGNKSSIFSSALVQKVNNGWFRCIATFITYLPYTFTVIGLEEQNGRQFYKGDGSSGIYAWGVQVEKGLTATSYIRTNERPVKRAADVVTLIKPENSGLHDVFIQRMDGGKWTSKIDGNYEIPTSASVTQVINFYDTDDSIISKEETAQNLFPQEYAEVGESGTLITFFERMYNAQHANKRWSLLKAINKSSPIYRFEVKSGDVWYGDINNQNRERSEFYMKNSDLPFDQDIWLSFSMRIAEGDALNLAPTEFCYIGQFHASPDEHDVPSPPILALRLDGLDTVNVFTCSTPNNPHRQSPKSVLRGSSQFTRGVWHKIVMRTRFSTTRGQLQWWKNGEEVIDLSGIEIGYPDRIGPYWKFGIYRSPMPQTLTIEYANMELSYDNSLRSRIAQPLLIV